MNITFQSSVIFVQDLASSRHFYEDLLGQQVDIDFGPSIGFKAGFALWQVDHAFQTIYEQAPESAEQLGHRNVELCFETADLETTSTCLSEAGVEYVHPLREHPWGQRVFRVYDPDGHIVEVGEPMSEVIARLLGEGRSVEAVSRQTAMPPEIVQHIAATQ